MAIAGLVPVRFSKDAQTGAVTEFSFVVAFAVGGGAVCWQLLTRWASDQEEAHVLQLLMQKLGFAPASSSFDAFLYLQDPQFGFLPKELVYEAAHAGALSASTLSLLIFVLAGVRRLLLPRVFKCHDASHGIMSRGCSMSNSEPSSHSQTILDKRSLHIPWASWVAQFLFLIALALLALLVNRLRVITAPFLCVLGAMVASPLLWKEAFGRHWFFHLVSCVVGAGFMVLPFYGTEVIDRALHVREFQADYDMRELVQWISLCLLA